MTKLEKDLEKAAKEFDAFDENVKAMSLDHMNQAPVKEVESQSDVLKISQKEKDRKGDIYLKPNKSIGCQEKFNEKYREDYEFAIQNVRFECQNIEIIGESVTAWTKPFAGMPAQEWIIPVNTAVWGPRHLAEQLTRCCYHRIRMDEKDISSADGSMTYLGKITVDETIHRINARPAVDKRSVFMGAANF